MDSEMIMIVSIIAIACITGLIKTWMNYRYKENENGISEENFNRLAQAFMQHKKEMQKRVENLEATITENDEKDDFQQIEAPNNEGSLTNDLQQKDKVRS